MKKVMYTLTLILGVSFSGIAQQVLSSSSMNRGNFENEVKVNFMNLIALGSIEVGYERYLSETHAIDFQVHINDRFGFNGEGDGKTFKTNSVQASMNFYLGNGVNGRFYLFPLAKIRFGEFEEVTNNVVLTTDMTSFILGAGTGYKWELSENFAFGPYVSVARGFRDSAAERFSRVELNGGFSLGYRF